MSAHHSLRVDRSLTQLSWFQYLGSPFLVSSNMSAGSQPVEMVTAPSSATVRVNVTRPQRTRAVRSVQLDGSGTPTGSMLKSDRVAVDVRDGFRCVLPTCRRTSSAATGRETRLGVHSHQTTPQQRPLMTSPASHASISRRVPCASLTHHTTSTRERTRGTKSGPSPRSASAASTTTSARISVP